jgi:hypothetical protein
MGVSGRRHTRATLPPLGELAPILKDAEWDPGPVWKSTKWQWVKFKFL